MLKFYPACFNSVKLFRRMKRNLSFLSVWMKYFEEAASCQQQPQ